MANKRKDRARPGSLPAPVPNSGCRNCCNCYRPSRNSGARGRYTFQLAGRDNRARRVTSIRRLGRHDTAKSDPLSELAINVEQRRIDAKRVARNSRQSFDKKWGTGLGIVRNTEDMVGAKNKNVAVMRLDEVVTELVDKDLVSGVDRATGDDIAAMISVARRNMKIRAQCFRRCVNQKLLVLADDARKGKEEREFFRHDLHDFVVLLRDDVDVVATENNKGSNLSETHIGGRAALGWPIIPLSVGCIEPVGILNGCRK